MSKPIASAPRSKSGATGMAQLSCWIRQETMDRMLSFVAERKTMQRTVVDEAISAYLASCPDATSSTSEAAEVAHGQ